MAIRAKSIIVSVKAILITTGAPQTGDAANITIKVVKDGTAGTSTNAVAEVDSVNAPGIYKLTLTASEMTADFVIVVGKSATASVRIDGWQDACIQVPDAAPGAASGLHINGSNAGTTTFGALTCTGSFTVSDGLLVSRSSSNTSAITATGNGTGSGLVATSGSGATGDGIQATSASTNGNGLSATGKGTGAGQIATGGLTGNGVKYVGGGTSGDALLTSATSGHGATFAGTGTTKHGINATGGATSSQGINAAGGGTGAGILATAGATGIGLSAVGGATSGSGMKATGTAGNAIGFQIVGQGSADGLSATGGTTGNGISATGTIGLSAVTTSTVGLGVTGTLNVSQAMTLLALTISTDITASAISVVNSSGSALTLKGSDPSLGRVGLKVQNGVIFDHTDTTNSVSTANALTAVGTVDFSTATGSGLSISTTAVNSSAVFFNASGSGGTGYGFYCAGGGSGVRFEGGATGTAVGMEIVSTTGNAEGMKITGHGTAAGIQTIGGGTAGSGVMLTAGSGGAALTTSGNIAVTGKLTTSDNVEIGNFVVGGAISATSVSISGNYAISGNLTAASLGITNDITATNLAVSHYVGIVDDFSVTTRAEPGSVPAATATPAAKLDWIGFLARNKLANTALTATTGTLAVRDNGDTVDVATAAVSDDGTTAIRDKFA